MRLRVVWLNLIRTIVFIASAGTLACHIAQIILLGRQRVDTPGVGSWWPKYIPYTLYFVGGGFSLLCSFALIFTSMSNVKSIRADRVLSIINLPLLIAVIVYNTLKSGVIPWTDGKEDGPSEVVLGFATYCDAYTGSQTTFLRCWLTNGVWLGLLASAVLWFVLAVYTFTQSSSDIYDDDYDAYDFKADVPMALTPPSAMHKTQVYEPGTPTSYSPSPAPLQPAQSASNADYNYKYYNYPSYEGYYDPAYAPQQQGGYPPYHSPATVAPYTGYEYNGPSAYQNTTPRHEDTVHMMSDMSDTKHLYAQGSGPQQQSPVTAGPPPVPQKDGGFGTEPPHSHDADKQHYNKL